MSTAPTLAPVPTPPPPDPMKKGLRIAFGLYMIVLNIVLVYLLFTLWPDDPSSKSTLPVQLFWGKVAVMLAPEQRFLLIVILAGALGSYIHTATSFADFLGNRKLFTSWAWWYLLRPFIGMALALVVYFAVRGGLIGASTGASGLSPFGVAAIAGLSGMFSKQATDKLREVFENLFKTEKPPDRTDKLNGNEA